MKRFNLFSVLALALVVSFASCKDSGAAATDDARESLATTQTTTPATTPAKPATPAAEVPTGPLTKIEFMETSYDYGEIMEGDVVNHTYKFKNTGSEPLIISNAKGSCGCTVPEWPREPIAVGGTGEIKVTFNSKNKGKVGGNNQSKRVTITANTDPANTFLTIKGKVNKPEGEAAPTS